MTRTVQDHWQLVEEILGKKSRLSSDGRQLRESTVALLATPEGRESIQRRLKGEGGSFDGRRRFVEEICRAFESQNAALLEMSQHDRFEIQETVVEKTQPKADQAYWDMLWLLHRDGKLGVGQMVCDSLAKISKKSDDLLRTLPSLHAWEHLSRDRIATLLEAAQQVSGDSEWRSRIDRVLSWANAARSGEDGEEIKGRRELASESHDRAMSPKAETNAGPSNLGAAVPGTMIDRTEPSEPAKGAGGFASVPAKEVAAQTLFGLFTAIQRLFRHTEEERDALCREQDDTRKALAGLRAELQTQKELASEYLRKADRLEHALNDRATELASARDDLRKLEGQLAEMRQQVEATHRRTEDYIHEASLARDNAVSSFQATLWQRLRAYLIEVLDGHTDQTGLTADQVFFRHRLQEIRETLRDLGVPPY